jgi:hypothetical protein
VPDPAADVAQLTALLRHHRRPLCTTCAAAKLGVEVTRALEATDALAKIAPLDQQVATCSVCGRTQWVLSLTA